MVERVGIRVFAPDVAGMSVVTDGGDIALRAEGEHWVGEVDRGTRYGLRIDAPTASGILLDPMAAEVWFPEGHSRDAARGASGPTWGAAPLAIARGWPSPRPQRWTQRPLLVHEVHVRGMTMARRRDDAGTYRAFVDELPRLAALGVSVVELLPVHQFDPDEDNYWGYMPLVFGAVHRQYAASDDAAIELADLVTAAHELDIEVWIDVVFNHTTEEDETGPTYNLRALADDVYYVKRSAGDDGGARYANDSGTGNVLDLCEGHAQALVMTALDRFADLGIDGFRFDLASILARDAEFVRSIGDWADRRGVRLVAEPWDMARYLVGRRWPDRRWMQWNDRFRDGLRSFLRGEPGMVAEVIERIEGSPDLFDDPLKSVNFLTAHDGFTMYDLVAYDRKHNDANGWDGHDGAEHNRSWNCGWEGDEGVPASVMALRRRQLRNAWTLLMLSHGVPMFVGGDEFARTQLGNNNPYRIDDETTWMDWSRRDEWSDLESYVARLTRFRAEHAVLSRPTWWGDDVEWFGIDGPADLGDEARAIAWHLPGLYVMANMWWEPLDFDVQAPGRWTRTIDTSDEAGFVAPDTAGEVVRVGPRSMVVLVDADGSSTTD